MRILMVDDRLPDPAIGYGYPRAAAILDELLAQGHEIFLLPAETFRAPPRDEAARPARSGIALAGSLVEASRIAARADVLWVSRLSNLRWLRQCAPSWLAARKWLYDIESLDSPRNLLWLALGNQPAPGLALDLAREAAEFRGATAFTAASRLDAERLEPHGIAPIEIIGESLPCRPTPAPFPQRHGILFVGSFHNLQIPSPNFDAIRFFVNGVWPILAPRLGTHLTIAGHGAAQLRDFGLTPTDRLRLVDSCPDLAALYDSHRLLVAPTRFASGVPRKVAESLAHGLPAIVSDILAAQLARQAPDAAAMCHASAAATPADYVARITRLYQDEPLWQRHRAAGLAAIATYWSPEIFTRSITRALTRLTSPTPQPRHCERSEAIQVR
jgi:glycosyltransferase involved in cell wall biosynthesis